MYAWSFAARTPDEVGRLVRALSKHRYVKEADLRVHFTVDRALSASPLFARHAASFEARREVERDLDLCSRDPSLWRPATLDEIILALTTLWSPDAGGGAGDKLLDELEALGLDHAQHEPFSSSPEEPPFPELILLDWILLPVDELDADRHAGALGALEDSGDEIHASLPIYQEATPLAAPELVMGASNGVLVSDFLVWSEGPYAYADYVFRGAAKAAKLVDPPEGYRDID